MKTTYTITSDSIPATVVNPVGRVAIKDTLEREQIFHLRTIDELIFKGDDFTLINNAPDLEKVSITVTCDNNGAPVTLFEGAFTKSDCKFDLDNCVIKVKPEADDLYKCLFDVWEADENIYYAAAGTRTTAALGVYEILAYCETCCTNDPTNPPPTCTSNPGLTDDYCVQYAEFGSPTPGGGCEAWDYEINTCWHRMIGIGTPTTPPPYGSGWTYLSGNNWWRCPSHGELLIGVLSHGRVLNDTLEYLFQLLDCTLTPRSHFFGFNNNHAAPPSNDAYAYAEQYLQKITIHQKSDVKRPYASNKAAPSVWVLSIKALLDDFREMFNVFWKISGQSIIIEHISYFESISDDLSALNIKQRFEGGDDGAPREETYSWSDEYRTSDAFGGYPIIYKAGKGKKEHKVTLFTNDIVEVRNSANAEHISDKGFCLVSNEVNGTDYAVLESNAPLGFVMLHENLHKHYRYFIEGTMNDTDGVTFETVRRSRKLESFMINGCCGNSFDPADTIILKCGSASVYAAEYDLTTDKIKIDAKI